MASKESLQVVLFSFGFKYGVPTDANVILDVRFLPNPYWVEKLRPETGLVEEVAAYALESDEGREFIALLKPMAAFLVEQNSAADKKSLRIAIGCTGGRHRSVAVIEALAVYLEELAVAYSFYHRDIERDGMENQRSVTV
ncbi:MAG: hypothetical protein JRC87_10200 [Deltaproteobacteria bacterium]|nr:hypothetical protein [Deltaproteobacteria bacterium]MBW2659942.1 hypothetical protein [Deltaproteobacteria bacterium]